MRRIFKSFVIAFLLMFCINTGVANASPLTYTQYHCIAFSKAVVAERWSAGVNQVRYLSRSYTLNSVERYADAWLNNPTSRNLNGLVNNCYNVVFYA